LGGFEELHKKTVHSSGDCAQDENPIRPEDAQSLEELGVLLRKFRESEGESLEGIADKTKVSLKYIRALEGGEHDLLPGSFYGKCFLKAYVSVLKKDPDPWTQRFGKLVGFLEGPDEEAEAPEENVEIPVRRLWLHRQKIWKVGLVLAVLAALALSFYVVWGSAYLTAL
jgi:cytoskeletal protein RodZ